jgi:hypothetical protein
LQRAVAQAGDTILGRGVQHLARLRLGKCQGPPGAPSKKNATGTFRICEMCCSRLALMRFFPFLNLLERQIERAGQRFLAQPQHFSPHPHAISEMLVDSRIGNLCHVDTQ